MRKGESGNKERGKDIIYVVPHSHYDVVWVFTKEDYFRINTEFVLSRVVRLLEEFKEYRFLIEQTFLLEEIERRNPALFEKIKKFIKEGRIEIANGEYLMADTMLPQEETIVREILVGKRYVKQKFGKNVEVMWQADSFGLNAQLPQVYRKSGYKYLAFRRGSPEIKPSEFWWEGLDGTRILTHVFPLGYRAGLYLDRLEDSYSFLKECAFANHILMPSGSGSTPPQRELVEVVRKWNQVHKDAVMKIATPSEFFKAIERYAKELPVRKGEMYCGRFSMVFPDTASTRIWIKLSLRKLECDLLSLERFDTVSGILSGHYRKREIDRCWKRVLFNAFHDILPGTGVDECYAEVKQNVEFLRKAIPNVLKDVLKQILSKDSNEEENGDVAVFNPLSWDVENWVEVDLNFEEGEVRQVKGVKSGDEERKVEILRMSKHPDGSIKHVRIGFVASVPALGYKIYRVIEREPREVKSGFLKRSNTSITNEFFSVEFNPENGIISVTKDGNVLLKEGNEIVVESESGNLYTHKEDIGIPLKTESGEGVKFGRFRAESMKVEETPLRVIVTFDTKYYSLIWPYRLTKKFKPVMWRHNYITFSKRMIVYKDLPRIDFVTLVRNNHPRVRVRVRFSTNLKNDEYACDTQFGAINRKANMYYFNPTNWMEKPTGTYPTLRWMDYSYGKHGITFMNRGTPEHEVRDDCVYLTLLRSVDLLAHGKEGPAIPVLDALEIGKEYEFRYAVYPHEGSWVEAKSYKRGYEFNYDLVAFQVSRKKKFRRARSFLRITPDNVVLTALKKAEDGNGVILRVYEAVGRKAKVRMEFFQNVESARVVNLLEEYEKEFDKRVEVRKNKVEFDIKPFEIVTLRVKLKGAG